MDNGKWVVSGQGAGRPRGRGSSGFTLVEVLVVLAILVLLFALLFAPMMTAFDQATVGQEDVRKQDAARRAIEQIKRELASAVYVYPAEAVPAGARVILNTSQLVFVPPARTSTGSPALPLRPQTVWDPVAGQTVPLAVAYTAHLADRGQGYGLSNPFVLWREQGIYRPADATHNTRWIDTSISQGTSNALSPRDGMDIPVAVTVCLDCGEATSGYIGPHQPEFQIDSTCPSCGSSNLMYVFRGLQFRPERIACEELQVSDDGTVYRARHGAWDGVQNPDWISGGPLTSVFDPRIVVYRYSAATGAHTNVVYDTHSAGFIPDGTGGLDDPDTLYLTWNNGAGGVRVGRVQRSWFYSPAERSLDILATTNPYSFRVEPSELANAPAKIVPGDVRVALVGLGADGTAGTPDDGPVLGTFSRADTWQADELGSDSLARNEFWFGIDLDPTQDFRTIGAPGAGPDGVADGQGAELRFSRFIDWGALGLGTTAELVVEYTFRCNFDASTGMDDVVKADYSTRSIMNIALIVADFLEPDLRAAGETSREVPLTAKVEVGNLGR